MSSPASGPHAIELPFPPPTARTSPGPRRRATRSRESIAVSQGPHEHAPRGGPAPQHWRTIWISDVHLGTRGCKAEALLHFLQHNRCERLYLVGDILDGWQLKRRWYWDEHHEAVVQRVLLLAATGTEVTYVPGNHDEALRSYGSMTLAGVDVRRECVHETADGRRLLVQHGDEYDAVVTGHRWLAHLGDRAYEGALIVNRWFNFARRSLGYPYWSLSGYLKQRVKDAVSFVGEFEKAVAREAKKRGVDGVVCGHIHKAELREIDGVLYANDGDWVESCSALVEDHAGQLEIVRWAERAGLDPLQPRASAVQGAAR